MTDYAPQKYELICKLSETKLPTDLSPLYVEQFVTFVETYDKNAGCWQYFINNQTTYLIKGNRRLVTRKFERVGNGFKLIHYFSPRYSIYDENELDIVKFYTKKEVTSHKLNNGKLLCIIN